jgi:hypothetical protein
MMLEGDTYKLYVAVVHKLHKCDSDVIYSYCYTRAPCKTPCFLKKKFYKINSFYSSFHLVTMVAKQTAQSLFQHHQNKFILSY